MKTYLKFIFVGDFCSSKPELIQISPLLSSVINRADIKVVNFEGPLASDDAMSINGNFLNQSDASPKWLVRQGFNIFSLANNHMLDFGEKGVLRTKDAFAGYKNIELIGCGTWEQVYNIKIIKKNGWEIGFLSVTSCDMSSLKDTMTDKDKIGCAWINSPVITQVIINAKKACDYLIVIAHCGVEYMDVPLPEWRERYKELLDLGVDAIVATHPHVPQGIEQYKDKYIFYSLGNFYFDMQYPRPNYWDNGMMIFMELGDDGVKCESYATIRTGNLLDLDNSRNIKAHFKFLSDILYDDIKYQEKLNSDVLKLYDKYKEWLLSGFNARELNLTPKNIYKILRDAFFRKKNLKLAMHQLREESSHLLIVRALKLLTQSQL